MIERGCASLRREFSGSPETTSSTELTYAMARARAALPSERSYCSSTAQSKVQNRVRANLNLERDVHSEGKVLRSREDAEGERSEA